MSTTEQPPARDRKLSDDLLGGLTLLGIAAVFLGRAGEGNLDWLFPRTLSYVLATVGVILVVRGLLGRGRRVNLVPGFLRGERADVLGFVGLIAVYVVLAKPIGFWIMSAIVILAGAVYLDPDRSLRRTVVAASVAVAVTVGGFLLLTQVFYVPLPKAKWWPF